MEVTKPIKVGNVWTNLISNSSGASVNYEEVAEWYDGTPMNDSKADGVVYRKLPSSVGGGYVKLIMDGVIPLSLFGLKEGEDSAASNVLALRLALGLVSDGGAPITGRFMFPPGGVYHINDFVDKVKRGVVLDLQGSTLIFSKEFEPSDNNQAIFRTLGDFEIHNGYVHMEYARGGGVIGFTGSLVRVGARFLSEFDAKPFQGNFAASNLNIECNSNVSVFSSSGALNNIRLDNIIVDGKGEANTMLQYEWGFVTDEPNQADRTTGHAANIKIDNCFFENGSTTTPFASAVVIRGAYNVRINNLKVINARLAVDLSPGEAAYFRTSEDHRVKGANLVVNGLVAEQMWQGGIAVGATVGPGSYVWDSGQMTPEDAVDLCSHTIENFVITGTETSSYCITGDSRNLVLRNGRITGFQRGMFLNPEIPKFTFDNIEIRDCKDRAIYFHATNPIITPIRRKRGSVENCQFSKISTTSNTSIIQLVNCMGVEISNNLFDASEGNVSSALSADATNNDLVVRNNRATGAFSEEAYVYGSTTDRGNILESNSGITSNSGNWILKDTIVGNTTIDIGPGGKFSTINEGLTWLSNNRKQYTSNIGYVRLRLLSGFVMSEQVLLRWGQDLGWVEITAQDAEVTISRQALTTGLSGSSSLIAAFGADMFSKLPRISCLFTMDSTGSASNRHGVVVRGGSTVEVAAGCGIKSAGSVGLYVTNNAVAVAGGSNFSGAGQYGVACYGGWADITNADTRRGALDDPTDARVLSGGLLRASGLTGGTSETANTLTSNGIIFQ